MAIKYKLRINGSGYVNEIIDCGTSLQKSLTSLDLNLGDAVEVASYDDDGNSSEWSAPVEVTDGAENNNGGNGSNGVAGFTVQITERTTPINAAGANIGSFPLPAMENPQFTAYLTNAAASGNFTLGIAVNGVSVLASPLTIAAGEKVAAAQVNSLTTENGDEAVISLTSAADGTATGLFIVVSGASSGAPPEPVVDETDPSTPVLTTEVAGDTITMNWEASTD